MVGAIALMHDAHTKYKNAEYTNIRKRRNWWIGWRTIDDEDVATIPRIRLDMQ